MAAAPSLQGHQRQIRAFSLPVGYVDDDGSLQQHGEIRLATALDEVEPLADPRVHANRAYLSILLLSRVVVRLGDISPVPPAVIERLYSVDFSYLQDLFIRLNDLGSTLVETECPSCGRRFAVDVVGEYE